MKYIKGILITVVIMTIFTLNTNATSGKAYNIGDHVYFNPVTNTKCNNSNYWTINNPTGTCYRYLVIDNSAASDTKLKLMLDHSYKQSTYENYQNVLIEIKTAWTNYSGTVDIISENEVKTLLKIDTAPAIGESIHGIAVLAPIRENSLYYLNGATKNTAGFWTKTVHPNDSSYAYSVTEYGNNKPVVITASRGIRPVITVDKSLVANDKETESLKGKITKAYSYQHLTQKFDGYTYKQMQGFTMAEDKLFYYSSNNGNKEKGIVFGYGGTNYEKSLGYYYENMGHGNDMTYNQKTKKILIVGPNSYKNIWQFNPETFKNGPEKKYSIVDTLGISTGAIAYNKLDDIYYLKINANVVSSNNDFTKLKDGFAMTHTETGQGFEFKNGYIYVSAFETGEAKCPHSYQLYCYGTEYTGKVYVYNAKYNSDGKPSPNYGRLVATYSTPTNIGELETVSFEGNKMYFGFAAQHYDSTNTYQIYSTPISNVSIAPTYKINYTNGKVIITSEEDLKSIPDWTLSSDKKTLTKDLTQKEETVSVCDRYSNCKNQVILPLDTIAFSNNETTYTGSPINVNTATSKSGTEISYKYYSDNECTKEIGIPINAGTYYVKATSAGNNNYISNSKCASLKINKGNPKISLAAKETNYTGTQIKANAATAKAPNNTTEENLTYNYIYYLDNQCSSKIPVGEGINKEGGTPINAGTYYVKANSEATTNLNSGSSPCVSHKIKKTDPSLQIEPNINMGVTQTITVDYNVNSTGKVTCSSSDEQIATCRISDNKLKITSKKLGKATINLAVTEDTNFNEKNNIPVNVTVIDPSTDRIKPVVTISPTGNNTFERKSNIMITLTDNETGIKPEQTVYYGWSISNIEEPEYLYSTQITGEITHAKVFAIEESSMTNLSGIYYLWIKAGINDINNNASNAKVSDKFYFNNTPPVVDAKLIKSKIKTKATLKTSSLSKISKYEYSTDGENYTNVPKNIFTIDTAEQRKYYFRITDELGQISEIEKYPEEESTASLESYILNKDNSEVIKSLVDLTDKNLNYVLYLGIPSLDSIIEKYNKLIIKNTLDKKLTYNKESIKILNKIGKDVKSDFKISTDKNIITLTPNNISDDVFYGEHYTVLIETRIADDYQPNEINKIFTNKSQLSINDTINETNEVESSVSYQEQLTNIPNTLLHKNEKILILGILLILTGISLLVKNLHRN